MKVDVIKVGMFQTNCYLVYNDSEMLVIDPGASFKKIDEAIQSHENVKVLAILLTHGHFDHIGAADRLKEKYNCPIIASRDDEKILRNEKYNNLAGFAASVRSEVEWLEKDELNLGSIKIRILYTPGHSAGSVMYVIDNKLFSGDTLFRLSVGRTDLYSGSGYLLNQSLQKLFDLDRDMIVYPGHEASTTVGFELDYNPYIMK
ncbi:MAG TPA: MBL fold metallo-hydrolase [Erysipelotrichaceae bacterium]|nr:MBL fold metallo-hydrolase [Erysipelotrichaceae bacterium]